MKKYFLFSLFLLSLSITINGQDVSKGIALYESNQLDEALDFFKSLDDNGSTDHQVPYYLGRISFDKEEFKEAESYFSEAIDRKEDVSDYHVWLGNSIGSYARDVSMLRKGILAPKIRDAFERGAELDPKNIEAHKGLIEFYIGAPGFLGGSWEKAEESAMTIKELDPREGHLTLANLYQRKEDYDKAEQEYIAVAKLDESLLVRLGLFYQSREKFDEAFTTFQKAYDKDPENLNALYQIGRTSALSGTRADLGIESLNKFLGMEWKEGTPSHAGALMRLAMIYEKSGQEKEAIENYKKSLELDPEMEQAKEGLQRLK